MNKINLQLFAGTSYNEATLLYKTKDMTDYKELEYLMEIPEIGGDPEQIDVTTLQDKYNRSIPGTIDLGDLEFVFLYDVETPDSNYRVLKKLQDDNEIVSFKLMYPDGSGHEFDAYVSVKVAGGGINTAKTFTARMFLQSEITDIFPE